MALAAVRISFHGVRDGVCVASSLRQRSGASRCSPPPSPSHDVLLIGGSLHVTLSLGLPRGGTTPGGRSGSPCPYSFKDGGGWITGVQQPPQDSGGDASGSLVALVRRGRCARRTGQRVEALGVVVVWP